MQSQGPKNLRTNQNKVDEWRRQLGIPKEEEAISQQLARLTSWWILVAWWMLVTNQERYLAITFRTAGILKSSRLAGTFGLRIKVSHLKDSGFPGQSITQIKTA